jgi:hypothetical protein
MAATNDFLQAINNGYTFKSESVQIGVGMLDKWYWVLTFFYP